MLFIMFAAWSLSGVYLTYRGAVAFAYYLHMQYSIVTPVVESPTFADLIIMFFSIFFGPVLSAILWSVVYFQFLKPENISATDAWNAEVGKSYVAKAVVSKTKQRIRY